MLEQPGGSPQSKIRTERLKAAWGAERSGSRVALGATYRMPDLLEALRGEKDRARAVLAFVDAGSGRSKQGDHGDETDGEQGQCG